MFYMASLVLRAGESVSEKVLLFFLGVNGEFES